MQPFLKKIFEGIHGIQFEENMDVTAMISEEGEMIQFIKPFNPKDAMGSVEKWLTQVRLGTFDMVLIISSSFKPRLP